MIASFFNENISYNVASLSSFGHIQTKECNLPNKILFKAIQLLLNEKECLLCGHLEAWSDSRLRGILSLRGIVCFSLKT